MHYYYFISCFSGFPHFNIVNIFFLFYLVDSPKHASSDRFVLSKGHACPILYAALCEVGLLTEEHLLTLRKVDSILEGHPTPIVSRLATYSCLSVSWCSLCIASRSLH